MPTTLTKHEAGLGIGEFASPADISFDHLGHLLTDIGLWQHTAGR